MDLLQKLARQKGEPPKILTHPGQVVLRHPANDFHLLSQKLLSFLVIHLRSSFHQSRMGQRPEQTRCDQSGQSSGEQRDTQQYRR